MQKIIPHLWYDKEAKEAANFYTSIFPDSKVISVTTLHNTPSGDTDVVSFEILGYEFKAISAGPIFKFTPAVSFMVNFDPSKDKDAKAKLDDVWKKLSDGGKPLMPLDKYPFSEHYGWIQDKYGLSWQLILTNPGGEERPSIIPSIMFIGENAGKAEEATDFYISIFRNARRGMISRYPAGMEPDLEGSVMFTDFMLENQWFGAMDSRQDHKFNFTEAISFIVNCEDQEELDNYWTKLSAVPEFEQCGWLKDKYGLSWQIVPREMDEMMSKGTPEQVDRLTQAFLPMKKLDLPKLKAAFEGK
jgi:predicted 3-demethylubiquinone-9 3-methyltransferase (glyoxalase superfamily)